MYRLSMQIFGAVLAMGLSGPLASAQTATTTTSSSMSTTTTTTSTTTTRPKSEATPELIIKVIEDSLARTRRAKETGTEERFDR